MSVEDLERRTLLASIAYTLTTDQSVYQPGQPIQIEFTETNTGTQPVTVSLSPTDFTVSEQFVDGYSPVWESNPENDGQPPTSVTLQAGQSVSQTATWNGTIMQTAFQLQQGANTSLAVNQFGTFTVSNPNAPSGNTATFQITDPLRGTLTSSQAIYQLGQPVQLSFAETNTSDQTVTTTIENPILYQLFQNGQRLSPAMDPLGTDFEILGPGQTAQHQITLSQADFGGPGTLAKLTGSFAVELDDVPAAPGELTADFQIVAPLAAAIVSSVTTNHSAYTLGESVRVTVTIPGTSTTAGVSSREQITVLDGTQVVSRLTRRMPAARLKQLEAGHSITMTMVWNGRSNQPVIHALKPGSYATDVTYGDSSGGAAITIGYGV